MKIKYDQKFMYVFVPIGTWFHVRIYYLSSKLCHKESMFDSVDKKCKPCIDYSQNKNYNKLKEKRFALLSNMINQIRHPLIAHILILVKILNL